MKNKQTIDAIERGLQGMRSAFSHAAFHCTTAADLHASMEKSLKLMGKAPRWAREYVKGYGRAEMDSLYRRALVFGGYLEGVFYSTHKDRADYYETRGIEPREFADSGKVQLRGHYWAKDTRRPFFIGPKEESAS